MKRLDELMRETGAGSSTANMPTISSPDGSSEKAAPECPLCGGLGYMRRDVPVGHPQFGKLFPCQCRAAEIERQRREQLRSMSNLDHLSHKTFEEFEPEGYALSPSQAASLRSAFEAALQFAQDPKGWLVLLGGFGSGKTHLAAATANRLIEGGWSVLFVVVPDLLDHLRATYGPNSPVSYDERFDEVRNAPILILDDLGTQSSTPWAQEKLFQIVNHRYAARLPTVITSNQDLEDIDLRIRSRLLDVDLSTVVAIQAHDFRGGALELDQTGLSSLMVMREMTFDRFELREDELSGEEQASLGKVLERCRDYAAQPSGWLVLGGVYGCGKTHLAAAIANHRASRGENVLFIVVPDLLDHLRATFSPTSQARFDRRFDEVKRSSLLVLDDLGTESASPWAREKLYQLFNYRYVARLATVITTSDEAERWDPRLRTRMLDQKRSAYLLIKAPSYRGSPKDQSSQKVRRGTRRVG